MDVELAAPTDHPTKGQTLGGNREVPSGVARKTRCEPKQKHAKIATV